mgnify:FL=1
MVIPIKGQYEQQCNVAALKEMGVPVIKSLKTKHVEKVNNPRGKPRGTMLE